MKIMLWVWPVNALWAGPLAIWAYRAIGNGGKPRISADAPAQAPGGMGDMHHGMGKMVGHDMGAMHHDMSNMTGHDMAGMHHDMANMADHGMAGMHHGMPKRPFWQSIVAGTLHCGAGCTLADLVTPWLFAAAPFLVLASPVFGEWTLAYLLALVIGVGFQYGGLLGMVPETGAALVWRALKVDFFSLSAWQVGMYGWMGFAIFGVFGPLHPTEPAFWLMMQLAMACGFVTAYPMNWLLVKTGVKSPM
ncbi:DUF4396 domain-containing protein [Crenobacter sp. HX-7-9]|uniref:DUF4396 domain-containing protein n=2 Tax=Crenobacter caeni TaxID=2705474 RepID=A0A6B2KT60_9NEIS|nr:DUF4396 domain-containing protein [Crenobacter caeni]